MQEKELLDLASKKGYIEKEIQLFEKALIWVKPFLIEKKRLSGDSYYDHNFRVAQILIENKAEPEVVIAGLLHRSKSAEQISPEFGTEVASLIKGIDEIQRIKNKSKKLEAEALRKILLTTLQDVRVILVKLASKLDNIKTMQNLPSEEQQRIAQEVLEVYAPLAYRLGLEKIKVQLENEAFKIIHPKEYKQIIDFLSQTQEQREKDITEAIAQIKKVAGHQVEILHIKGRPKHIYSIYRKMTEKNTPLLKQYDLLGIRIIVSTEKDCYSLLGLLHENFEPIEGRLKDYIANPKPNFYRSIHTGVKTDNGKILEIQIRTSEMDEFAEEGIAAHWRYKKLDSSESFEKKIAWLRGILDLQKDESTKEFLESAKVDVFGDTIFCYTPKGDVKELPKDSTILDFAFMVHEDVGNHAIGGRVNGKFVPLRHTLEKGDVVEVITNKSQHPHLSWLKIVRSGRTRQKIRKFLQDFKNLPSFHYRALKPIEEEDQSILVESEEHPQAVCILAKCCNPLPEDNIVGFITKRRVISVHNLECRQAEKERERWVKVSWKESFSQKIKFIVNAAERSGILADLLHNIATAGFECKEAKAKLLDLGNVQCSFIVVPRRLEELKELVRRIKKVRGVRKIYFE